MFQYKTLCFNKKTTYLKKKRHFDKKKSVFPEGILQCQSEGFLWKGIPLGRSPWDLWGKKKMRTSVKKMRTLAEKVHTW